MLENLGEFHCTCRFYRAGEFVPAILIPESECGYHSTMRKRCDEADKRDAARYRWLRKNRFCEWRDEDVLRCGISFANAVGPWEPDRFEGSQQKMDAAIDAAMGSAVSEEKA